MSLLMKALDKAAQDREKTPATSGTPTQRTDHELSLEALEPSLSSATHATRGTRKESDRSNAQAQAAAVLASGWQPRRVSGLDWMRTHPLYAFGAAAALFLAAYSAYVYVQIAHPTWLQKTPASPQLAAVTPSPAHAPQSAPAISDNTASGGATAAERGIASGTVTPGDAAGSQLIPLQSVFGGRGDAAPAPSLLPGPADTNQRSSDSATPRPPAPAAPAAVPRAIGQPETPSPPQTLTMHNRIAISRGDNTPPRVNPAISEAYAAYQTGQSDVAQRLYSEVLRVEPANVDALLGLAAIAQRENRLEDAQRLFATILEIEPRHALAQSGLIAMTGRADPHAAESRLKQLIAREPSAPLYFNLGNLYAEQGQWSQAQQAYFQAHHLEPRNPDYAYNLAVGLEHLGQQKLALDFYRKALQLSATPGIANFDVARAQERISQLAARLN